MENTDLVERVRALAPLIAANAERAEQIRRPVDEVIELAFTRMSVAT